MRSLNIESIGLSKSKILVNVIVKEQRKIEHTLFPLRGRNKLLKVYCSPLLKKVLFLHSAGEARRLEEIEYEKNKHQLESCRRHNYQV
jgi:hypothetical protein